MRLGIAAMTVSSLVEHFSHFDACREVALEVRFRDLDFEIYDWAFTYSEEFGGPTPVTSVHGSSLVLPDVVTRLGGLVDSYLRHRAVRLSSLPYTKK